MTIRTRVAFSGVAAALAFGLAACGGTTATTGASSAVSTNSSATSSASAMVTPTSSAAMTGMASSSTAMPMSSASMTGMMSPSASMSTSPAPAGPHNQADIAFTQMMLAHHQGAVEMADLAPTRAASSKVKDLAVKIKAEQTPEITQMNGWLAAWMPKGAMTNMPMSSTAMASMGGMSNGGSTTSAMPGMMSAAQMDQLKAANGAAFDKMFLQMMITHHEGAVEMAKTEKTAGQNPAALKLADSIIASQTAEIAVMQALLKSM